MSGPWFRRYFGFGYQATTWQGRVVIAVMALIAIPSALAWLALTDTRPFLASLAGDVAVAAALGGHLVVLWKMDWGYGGR